MSTHTRRRAVESTIATTLKVAGGAAGLLSLGLAMASCAKPLLSPTDERSPFDRFDALRAQAAPQYIEDEFGRQKPNLRDRLTPRE